jgi:hypothetical protein
MRIPERDSFTHLPLCIWGRSAHTYLTREMLSNTRSSKLIFGVGVLIMSHLSCQMQIVAEKFSTNPALSCTVVEKRLRPLGHDNCVPT